MERFSVREVIEQAVQTELFPDVNSHVYIIPSVFHISPQTVRRFP